MTALTVTLDRARAFWCAKQGLTQPASGDVTGLVARTGWKRTLGGVDVYLALRSRRPGLSREEVDAAAAAGDLRIVPAVRGCIYLVPGEHVPLVMALAADLSRPRTRRELDKVGCGWDEIDAVALEVLKALGKGPVTTQALRKELPEEALRGFGEAGKKVGISSPLPMALRELEFRAEIERRPLGGRLDTERYEWGLAPKVKKKVPADKEGRLRAVARHFFEFFGPATRRELATWVGISQRDAKAAMEKLPLVDVAVEGRPDVAFLLEDDLPGFTGDAPPERGFSFLSFEDNLLTVYGGPGVFAGEAHHGHPVKAWGSSKPATLGEARHVAERPLFWGHRLVGFWEYDPDAAEVVAGTLEKLPGAARKGLAEEREGLTAFIRDELGHARSFSLDTDEKVRARAFAVRSLGS